MKLSLSGGNFSDWGNRLAKPLPWLLYAIAVVWAVWVIQRLMLPSPIAVPAMAASQSDKFQMDQSAEARLLGVETSGGLTPPSVKLAGVFADPHGQGAAVMAVEGQPAQSFDVGSEVSNGWKLVEVGPSFAIIERSGQRDKLSLPKQSVDPNQFKVIRESN